MSAAAAACASTTAMVVVGPESEDKVWASILALPDREAINARIVAIVRDIMTSIEADEKQELDLESYRSRVVELKLLFERRHSVEKVEKLPANIRCRCEQNARTALGVLNKIWLAQMVIAGQSDSKGSAAAAAAVHAIGAATQRQAMRVTLAAFVALRDPEDPRLSPLTQDWEVFKGGGMIHKDILTRDEPFIELRRKIKALQKEARYVPPVNIEALREELVSAVRKAEWQRLEQFIAAKTIIVRSIGANGVRGLFEYAICHYRIKPKLEDRHFKTLDVLVRAGSDIRECGNGGGLYCTLAIGKHSEKASAVQLLHYLHRHRYQLDEQDHSNEWPAQELFRYAEEIRSAAVAETLLEFGLRVPNTYSVQLNVNEGGVLAHIKPDEPNIHARLYIGEGAVDAQTTTEADRKTFLDKVRAKDPASVPIIEATVIARQQYISAIIAKIASAIIPIHWENNTAYFPPPVATLLANYAFATDAKGLLSIWRNVQEQDRKTKGADAGAAAAPAAKK